MNSNTNDERREFFRIDDEIYLEVHVINNDEYDKAPEFLANLENDSFSLSADFATLNNNIHPILNNIKQTHPDIAQYLEIINKKIDSLGEHLLQTAINYDENKRITANLSASGIMFETKNSLNKDDLVKIEIVLFPEKIGVLVFGKVVKSTAKNDGIRNISIEFAHIRNEDQELMIKHNLNKQMEDIREKNDYS